MSAAAAPLRSNFHKLSTEALISARESLTDVLDARARQASLFEAPKPAALLVTPTLPAPYIPEVLSPSSVNCYQSCSAKWYFRKVLQLPETRTGSLALGSAVHEAVGANFTQKIDTFEDLDYPGVRAVFHDAMERQLDGDVTLDADESAADLIDCGETLVKVYMEQAAPSIQPAAVELPVKGILGGVPVHGFVDVLDVNGDVIDLKTAGKKPSGISADHRLQISTYAMLTPGASGRGRRDVVTKTKTVAHYSQTFAVTPADVKLTEALYSITRDQMGSGLIVPNRSSNLCSRKYCSFADECVSRFGGEVE